MDEEPVSATVRIPFAAVALVELVAAAARLMSSSGRRLFRGAAAAARSFCFLWRASKPSLAANAAVSSDAIAKTEDAVRQPRSRSDQLSDPLVAAQAEVNDVGGAAHAGEVAVAAAAAVGQHHQRRQHTRKKSDESDELSPSVADAVVARLVEEHRHDGDAPATVVAPSPTTPCRPPRHPLNTPAAPSPRLWTSEPQHHEPSTPTNPPPRRSSSSEHNLFALQDYYSFSCADVANVNDEATPKKPKATALPRIPRTRPS